MTTLRLAKELGEQNKRQEKERWMLSLVKASLSKRQDEGYKSCELDQ